MSVSTDIKKQLATTINALGQAQSVYKYNELNPTGWPCVWIVTDDLQGSFWSTAENKRVYSYKITCLFPLGEDFVKDGSIQREEYAENVLADVVDAILTAVEDTSFITTLNAIYSSGDTTVLFAEAADAAWGEVDMQKGKAKAIQMSLMIHTDYNTRT